MELSSKMNCFPDVATKQGVQCKVNSPSYHPQSNGNTKGCHSFLKAFTSKHMPKSLEWVEEIPLPVLHIISYQMSTHRKALSISHLVGTLAVPWKFRYLGPDEKNFILKRPQRICTKWL